MSVANKPEPVANVGQSSSFLSWGPISSPMPIQQQLHAAWVPVLTHCKHVIKGYPNHLNHQTRVLASATFWSTWQVAGWFKATKSFSHWVKMLNVEWHAKGCCTWTNVKKWANEISFHKTNGYEWSSPNPVHCWTLTWCSTLTTLAYFDPTVTASHKIWINMASESVLLHFAPCKMLQSVSTWNFKKRCCHLCGDRSCFSCGRSKAFKSIELSFGNARHCPHLKCCVQDSYAKFFWCVLTLQGQVHWHSLCCSIIPLWPGKAKCS